VRLTTRHPATNTTNAVTGRVRRQAREIPDIRVAATESGSAAWSRGSIAATSVVISEVTAKAAATLPSTRSR
jgi:hypothetical protein